MIVGGAIWGCRPATTPLGPPPPGSSDGSPVVATFPGHDTTVDSIGVLAIEVVAHDRDRIATVTMDISGAPIAFPPDTVDNTVFDAVYRVALGPLRHQPFGFRVEANNIPGRDTVTDSVHVRLL